MSKERKPCAFTDIGVAIDAIPNFPVPFWVRRNGVETAVEVACCEGSLRNFIVGTDFGKHDSDRVYLLLPLSAHSRLSALGLTDSDVREIERELRAT